MRKTIFPLVGGSYHCKVVGKVLYRQIRPLLDCEGRDFDIICNKLLDAISSTQFLLVPKVIQHN
jgi:hypothetical protein